MKTAALSDLPRLRPYFSAAPHRLSVYSPALLFMWREYFRLAFREEEGTLLLRLAYDGGDDSYLYPLGKDPTAAVHRLAAEHKRRGEPLRFFGLEEGELALLRARFPGARVESDRGEADYLYKTEELATLRGRRYGGQRNHLNKFSRLYPDHTIAPLTAADAPELLAFLDAFESRHAARPLLSEELGMTREVVTHFDLYGMDGLLLRVGGEIAAFACGEVMGDTLAVHIEKADTRIAGAYPRIVSAFAAHYDPERVPYLNREDDMNDEGLRTSKLSYHPTLILDKWRLTVLPGKL